MRVRLLSGLFVAALVALVPMRLVADWSGLDDLGLSAREASGSLWGGTLSEARLKGIPLGDIDAGVNPLPLVAGRLRLDFERSDELRGAVSLGRGSASIDDVTARLPLGSTFAPLPLTALHLDDVSVRFRDGLCVAAEGRARAEIDGAAAGLALPAALSGSARCEGGSLSLPLVSRSAMEALSLRLSAGNRYRADLVVRADEAAIRDRLKAAGFAPRGAGYILSLDGRFAQ